MTVLCGLAGSFAQLALARVGVGVGAAAGTPPSFSLLSDYVRPEKRATLFAIVNSAQPAGVFFGFLVGGWVASQYGWRAAFIVAGAPGLLLALLLWGALREPRRGAFDAPGTVAPVRALQVTCDLLRLPSYRYMVAGNTFTILAATAIGVWTPSYFMRVHGLSLKETAVWLATVYGVAGVAGAIGGGVAADRISAAGRGARSYALTPAIALLALTPCAAGLFLTSSTNGALVCLVAVVMLLHASLGPHYATVQNLAQPRERSMATAINVFFAYTLGFGFGPLLVGSLTDLLSATMGVAAIRYSILGVASISASRAAGFFWVASRTLEADLSAAHGRPVSGAVMVSV